MKTIELKNMVKNLKKFRNLIQKSKRTSSIVKMWIIADINTILGFAKETLKNKIKGGE